MDPVLGADVVFPGVDGAFSYTVPPRLSAQLQAGVRVLAPFGRRRATGTVVGVHSQADAKATRDIEHVLDDRPAFTVEMLKFTQWMAEYYLCPWGDVLKAALPAGMSLDETRHWSLATQDESLIAEHVAVDPTARAVIEALRSGPRSAAWLRKEFGLSRDAALLRRMEKAGIIAFRPVLRPPRVRSQFDTLVTLAPHVRAEYGTDFLARLRSVHEQHLAREIFESGPDGVPRSDLLKGATSARRAAFARLLSSGSLELRVEEATRWDPQTENIPDLEQPENLTQAQSAAIVEIAGALAKGVFTPFLLFGVTGSGKTQVYIECARRAVESGKTALILLPEIALTPFVWGRFYRAFGDQVAVQHSAQSPAVRYDLWRAIHGGRYPVVIGARSAVFAPLARLGLIVVDEEQEASYKQEETPRYHARDAALMRARMENAAIVLGSATPSVESFHHAQSGRYRLLRLPERVGGAVTPDVRIVTLQPPEPPPEDKADGKKPKGKRAPVIEPPILTDELKMRLAGVLARGRQAILLQNRRGFSPFLLCTSCGKVPACPNCAVSLTYHRRGLVMRCHYCEHREPAPDACPRCGASSWIAQGLGTQRLEEELAVSFPQARILRMDSDTVSRRGMHGRMVAAFAAGEYDLLAGTQMIAKGLDFPNVELSAVVQADTELFYPDFRASERGAALILQVAGRAGRRTEPGTVVVQTAVASHSVIRCAVAGDWESFVAGELANRSAGGYPPFARLILLRAVSKEESPGVRALLRLRRTLQGRSVQVLGPAPAVVSKIRALYRHQMLVRTLRVSDPGGAILREAVRHALTEYKRARGEGGVMIEVDVDPQSVA